MASYLTYEDHLLSFITMIDSDEVDAIMFESYMVDLLFYPTQ